MDEKVKAERAESLLRDMRKKLAMAHELEVTGNVEEADGIGARAANRLAHALFLTNPVEKPYAFAIDRDDREEDIRAAAVCK